MLSLSCLQLRWLLSLHLISPVAINSDTVYCPLHTVYCVFKSHNKLCLCLWFDECVFSLGGHVCVEIVISFQLIFSCLLWLLGAAYGKKKKSSMDSNDTLNTYCTSGREDQKFRCPHSHCTNHVSASCLKHNNTELKLQNPNFYFCKFAFYSAVGWLCSNCFSFYFFE